MLAPLTPSQLQAAADLSRNMYVVAGAGSGKTRVLAERYVNILKDITASGALSPRDAIERILVVTFTEKATMEMKRRIAARLAHEGLMDARRCMETARISTFHGFCANLLRENALEAGVDPGFKVVLSDELRWKRSALETAITEAFNLNDQGQIEVVEATTDDRLLGSSQIDGFGDLFGAVNSTIAAWRSVGKRIGDITVHQIGDHQQQISTMLYPLLRECARECVPILSEMSRFAGDCRESISRTLQTCIDAVKGLLHALKDPEFSGWVELVESIFKANAAATQIQRLITKHTVNEARIQSNLLQVQSAFAPIIVFAGMDLEAEERLNRMSLSFRRLAVSTWGHYEKMKRRMGALDNDDLQAEAAHLLTTNQEVEWTYTRRFDHLLVDEFQDTSHIQMRVLDALHKPGTNKLFVVGDAYQSIYGFRGADVNLFIDLQARFSNTAEASIVQLSENFRSSPPIVSFVNRVFSQVWADRYPRFAPLVPQRLVPTEQPAIEVFLSEKMSTVSQRQFEARAVAKHVKSLHHNGFRWSDIAILLRHFTHVELYESALRDAGIPQYRIGGGRGYYARREIRDVCNALTVIDNPMDDMATACTLRSPFFGVSARTLTQIAGVAQSSKSTWNSAIQEASSSGLTEETETLARFLNITNHLREKAQDTHVGPLLFELLRLTQLEQRLISRADGPRRVANLRKLVQMAHDVSPNENTIPFFINQIKMSEKLLDREGDAPTEEEAADVVRIITIHRAKGLEFPAVILPDLGRGHSSSLRNVFETDANEDWTGARICGYKNAVYRQVESLRSERDRQESQRLLYVAMTRARDRLSLFASAGCVEKGDTWGSLLLPSCGVLRVPTESSIREVQMGLHVRVSPMSCLSDEQGVVS